MDMCVLYRIPVSLRVHGVERALIRVQDSRPFESSIRLDADADAKLC